MRPVDSTVGWWITLLSGAGVMAGLGQPRIAQVPGVALAPIFGWRAREFFAAEPGETGSPDTSLRPAR